MKEKKNRAAIYCRLSVDDGVDQQSQSIANQKEVLTEYCLENGFIIENIYIDDGISGTTFDRPGFNKMISSIENGNIDIVITKDLSRLGRDYLSAGYYTEKYFPEHNIRYIAINDKVDTAQGLDDIVPLKNIMNEFYARDISKKIRFTVGNIMSKGDSKKAGKALYGYKYDKDSNRIINPKEAKVVKRIFKLFIEGNSISSICNILSKDRIPNPSTSNKEKLDYTWRYKTIYSIISNQEYLGHYIRKKTQTLFKSNKVLKIPKEEQYIFKNKYDPIIDVETFNLAQSLLESTKNQTKDILKKNPYAGLCYCAICGKRLIYNKHTSGSGYTEERLVCQGKEYGKGSIKLDELTEIIKKELINLKDVILNNKAKFLDEVKLKASSLKENKLTKEEEDKYHNVLKRYDEINLLIKSLVEQLSQNIITNEMYDSLLKEYLEEKDIVESSIKRYKLIEDNKDEKLSHQAHIIVDELENIKDEELLNQYFIRSLISKITISSIPVPHTMKKQKEITFIYKKCNSYLNEFLKEVAYATH